MGETELIHSRVVQTLVCMYAPHEHGQHLRHRVPSVACSGFLTVADIKCDVGATSGGALCYTRLEGKPFSRGILRVQ